MDMKARQAADETLLDAISDSIRSHQPLPEIDVALDLDQAYTAQHQVTDRLCQDQSRTIKAGVTVPVIQEILGIDHALLGSAYSASRHGDGAAIEHIEGRMLECELAVLVDSSGEPKAIAPAIEIVYVRFTRPEDMTAANLVLSNLGADAYIVGRFVPWEPSYDSATCTLRRNTKIVAEASMADAIGGPEKSTPWIWEESRKRGFSGTGDTLLLTGACGDVIPADIGAYEADFGPLGRLTFSIA